MQINVHFSKGSSGQWLVDIYWHQCNIFDGGYFQSGELLLAFNIDEHFKCNIYKKRKILKIRRLSNFNGFLLV